MTRLSSRRVLNIGAAMALIATLSACNTLNRLAEVGNGPELSKITNPVAEKDYKPVSMPMPAPKIAEVNPNSLWREGAKAFFKDQRAKAIGDILTVRLNLTDSASLSNKTERDRNDSESSNLSNFLGLEKEATKVLPEGFDPSAVTNFGNEHSTSGDGGIARSETIKMTMAAVITQNLPNGNLVIFGRQEMRVNSELRELLVTGIIRPEDIDYTNTIDHTKIAEMRVAYGGRGMLSDIQQPRWGTQVWDIIFPF